MQTGSHVLDAFNLDYDSFIDNITFRRGHRPRGQVPATMQKVCAYKPMADSMPPMLREEAFHLAAGVVPMRRWAQRAAQGDPLISWNDQHALTNGAARARDVGDERGGDTNNEVRLQGQRRTRRRRSLLERRDDPRHQRAVLEGALSPSTTR